MDAVDTGYADSKLAERYEAIMGKLAYPGGELMKLDLCGACLAAVRAEHNIKLLTRGVGNKITCAKCGRRRYGGTYEVTARDTTQHK